MAPEQPHFLLFPYSELGHINPMLSLASQLLRLGCRVTFIKADRYLPMTTSDAASAQPELRSAASSAVEYGVAHERLRFVTLPVRNNALCVDPKTMTRQQICKTTLDGLEDRQDLVAAIVEESKVSSSPITCIICDSMLWKWARHIARTHHLRSAVLCIFGGLDFYSHYLDARGKDEESGALLVKFGMPRKRDDTAYISISGMNESPEIRLQKRKVFESKFEGIEEAQTIFVNSFEALEAPLLPVLEASGFDVRFIGPCLRDLHKDNVGMSSSMTQAGSIVIEDTSCLKWLDEQENGSILYVAFGSEVEVDAKQVEEIELGIQKSGYKFLWVVRPSLLVDGRPIRGIFEQSKDQGRGMFVSWAPQVRVLQHRAVGGFLTHSGWSSTLESLTFGVPMLCLPIFMDHACVANFVEKYLQVGIRLSVKNDGLVHREEVLRGVQEIMQGCFSQKSAQFQESAQLAIQTVHLKFTSFLQAID